MPRHMKPRPKRERCPEHRRPVDLRQRRRLDERGAEPEIGEERHEDRKRDDDAGDPELGRDEQAGQDEQDREPRDLRHDLGGDLPRNTARRGPLQISRLGGFHRSQGMGEVDWRQPAAAPRRAWHERRHRVGRTPSANCGFPVSSGNTGVAEDGYSELLPLIETRPPHRAETTSRHAAQLRCLWNGISKSDANDIAKATASGTAIASVTRNIGIPDPTSRRRSDVVDCHHDR